MEATLSAKRARPFAVAALVCTTLASLTVLTASAFDQRRITANGAVIKHHASVWDIHGAWGLGTLLLPVVVAAFAVVATGAAGARRVAVFAAALLCAWTMLLLATIGVFYVPAAVLVVVAARRTRASNA